MNRRTRMMYERERDRESPRSRRYTLETENRYGGGYDDYQDNIYPMDRNRYRPSRMSMASGRRREEDEPRRRMGFANSYNAGGTEPLTMDEADDWVMSMHGEGTKKGGKWKFEETEKFAKARGMTSEDDLVEFYAVMNAMYSDYGDVAKKYGTSMPDFFADMAKAFIDDPDACEGKTALYFEHIVDG